MILAPSTKELPTCPRCGYDLRGALATWNDTCPLDGTCTECGLHLDWAHVLRPGKFAPAWCVEFAPRRGFGPACVSTFGRSFRPWRFWSALKMSMSLGRRRLVAYVALLILPVLVAYASVQTVAAIRMRYEWQQSLDDYKKQAQQDVAALERQLENLDDVRWRWSLRQRLRMRRQEANATYTINHSYPAAVAEAVFVPWRSSSTGIISAPSGSWPYSGPWRIRQTLVDDWDGWLTTLTAVGMGLWISLVVPVTFVLLPVSRRRARVRTVHLVRVASYGLFIPSAIITASLLSVAAGSAFLDPGEDWVTMARVLIHYGLVPMIVIWWAAAIRRYLMMPHAWAVALLLSLLSFLLLSGVMWLLAPDFFISRW